MGVPSFGGSTLVWHRRHTVKYILTHFPAFAYKKVTPTVKNVITAPNVLLILCLSLINTLYKHQKWTNNFHSFNPRTIYGWFFSYRIIRMFRRIVDYGPHVGTFSVLIVWQATHVRPEYHITLTGGPDALVCLHKQKRVLWYRFQNYHLFQGGCKKKKTMSNYKNAAKNTSPVLNYEKNERKFILDGFMVYYEKGLSII